MKLNVPNKWQQVPLEQLLEFVTGGDWGKDENYSDPDFTLAYCIRGSEIRNWDTEKGSTASLRKVKKSSVESRKLKEGDILVEISGGGPEQPVGRTVLIDKAALSFQSHIPKICTNFLRLIRPVNEIDSRYLNLFLKLFYASGDIVNYQGGSNNLRNLKFPDFIKIKIPLPPLPEQQAIVSKIEALFSELDKGKEQLETAQWQLKVYRQSSLKGAFEGDWQKKPLGEIVEVKRGKSKHRPRDAKELYGGKYPFIQTGEVKAAKGGTIKSFSQTYSELGLQQSKLWKKGTLCLTIAANIADTAFLGFDSCFPDSVVGIKGDESQISLQFINFFIQKIKQEIEVKASATAQKNINVDFLEKLLIPFPSIKEQNQVVQELERRFTICDKLEETITEALLQAETLRQSILKQAFEGKLVQMEAVGEVKVILLPVPNFPRKIEGIAETDLQAGIIAMVIDLHEKSPQHAAKLSHVKCEKISDQVERNLGISLGRKAMKDAAGPDDYPHLKKVEHRAKMIGAFKCEALQVGHTYKPMRNMQKTIDKVKTVLNKDELKEIDQLLQSFLPFELEHAELVATIFAGWNNLLLQRKHPTDEEIVYESRENWSQRKLTIPRENFFKTLKWMKEHHYIPEGKGEMVLKKEEVKQAPKKKTKKKKV